MIYPSSLALRVPAELRPRPIGLEVPRLTTTRDELVNVTFAVAAVIVGRGPFLRFTAGRAVVLFSVLPTRGVPFAGVCRYDPSGVPWRAIGWIAGPLTTTAELAGLVTAGPLLWTIGPLARFVIVLSAEVLIWTLVQSLRERPPATPAAGSGRLLHDGDLVRLAFAHHQAGIPPAAPPTAIR